MVEERQRSVGQRAAGSGEAGSPRPQQPRQAACQGIEPMGQPKRPKRLLRLLRLLRAAWRGIEPKDRQPCITLCSEISWNGIEQM